MPDIPAPQRPSDALGQAITAAMLDGFKNLFDPRPSRFDSLPVQTLLELRQLGWDVIRRFSNDPARSESTAYSTVSAADYDAALAVNRNLHAEIADAMSGRRCGRCWALTVNGHYHDCPVGGTDA